MVCLALGLAPKATAAAVFYAIHEHVQQLGSERVHPIFLLDEGHLLHRDVLEHLHTMANHEWDARALLSLVLVGLPELECRAAASAVREAEEGGVSTAGISLRSTLATITIAVVGLALAVSGVLAVLTSALHATTATAAASVESVRLAQQTEIDLLLHGRAADAVVRRELEAKVRQGLSDTRAFVTSRHEQHVMAEVEAHVLAYLTATRDAGLAPAALAHQQNAYDALRSLVRVNLEDARQAHDVAAAWDRMANRLALGVAALVLLAAVAVLIWLKRGAFAQVFALANAMDRFGTGQRETRVSVAGPAELREMSRRFNEMADAIAAQRQLQIAFLGGVAHDLKTPLSVLKMAVALLPPDRALPAEPELRQLIAKMQRQITRLERMANDFLDLTNIESGALSLKLDVHDAREIVGGVAAMFEGTVPEPRLSISLPVEPAHIQCDQLRMEQVLTNLVSNALKYSPAGSGIGVAVERLPEAVVLCVTDHGIGISEADQKRVFEPFRRAGLSKEAVPGVGLGLFIVRRIVEAHGGVIDVESTPGEGSSFSVRLPPADQARSQDAGHM